MTAPAYAPAYAHFARLERDERGLLTVTFHTDGGPWVLTAETRDLLPRLFIDIGQDRANRVVIVTGTGHVFCAELSQQSLLGELGRFGPDMLDNWRYGGNNALRFMVNIEAPIILALNGDLFQHAEIWMASDLVVAVPEARVQDFHLTGGQVPGGDAQVMWELLLGHARAKRFLLTGETLTAQALHELGAIGDLAPAANLLARAHAIADGLLKVNHLVLRYAKASVTEGLRRKLANEQPYTQALVMLGAHSSIPELLAAAPPA
jgi:enoyl-CoA hydratase/carnithine racemase